LPETIRFKLINDYYDDVLDSGKVLLATFQFLESRKASKFVLMMPRKKWRKHYSYIGNSYYKVDNCKDKVLSDFANLGLIALTYEDLMRDSI